MPNPIVTPNLLVNIKLHDVSSCLFCFVQQLNLACLFQILKAHVLLTLTLFPSCFQEEYQPCDHDEVDPQRGRPRPLCPQIPGQPAGGGQEGKLKLRNNSNYYRERANKLSMISEKVIYRRVSILIHVWLKPKNNLIAIIHNFYIYPWTWLVIYLGVYYQDATSELVNIHQQPKKNIRVRQILLLWPLWT